MTDQIEDLFAELRMDTLTQVRAPGTAAAHRTVQRRRRTHRVVGGAAFVAVIAAGGIGSHLLGPVPIGRQGEPDPATLAKRQQGAAGEIGLAAQGQTGTARSGQGIAAAGMVASELLVAGTYTVRFACSGPGRVTVRFRIVDGGVVQSAGQDCADAARTITFTLAQSATVRTELQPDSAASGQSGYAYRLKLAEADLDRLAEVAAQRVAEPAVSHSSTTLQEGVTMTNQDAALANGAYQLHYACVGVGKVLITLRTHHTQQNRSVTCAPDGTAGVIPFEITGSGDALTYDVAPDAEAEDLAGFAAATVRV